MLDDWSDSVAAFDERLAAAFADAIRPPPKLRVSEWADANRVLSSEASAEPGKWKTERAEYQRGIMDAVCDPSVKEVALMSSAQIGKTEALLNICGYFIEHDPAPMLLVQPTLDMAQAFSKDRLAPMVRECPTLEARVQDGRITTGTASTILHKVFPGGHITMAGSNSPASLASRPVRIALCDEVDRYPLSAGAEGDPVSLARKRTTTFWNRKVMLVSTPTVKGHSRIEKAYNNSDMRQFWVPCPKCGRDQVLVWGQVRWPKDRPEEAAYFCSESDPETGEVCEHEWTDVERWAAVRRGQWRARAEFRGIAGFHLSEIYSPWVPLGDMARNFVEAKRLGPSALMTFINTSLGETWEEQGDRVNEADLESRKASWEKVPAGVAVVTAGVDVQDDRIEIEVVGWGRNEESWSLDYIVLRGDPSGPQLWAELDRVLMERRQHDVRPGGAPIDAVCIDTGGHHTQKAYVFCRDRFARRVWAVKGVGGQGKPIWPRRNTKTKSGAPLFIVGVDTAKETIYRNLRVPEPGAGYCHFPADRDDQYFRQLTSEEIVTKFQRGFPVRVWQLKAGNKRNEALDCRAYAYAALHGLIAAGLRLNERAARLGLPEAPERADDVEVKQDPRVSVEVQGEAMPPISRPRFVRKRRTSRSSMM